MTKIDDQTPPEARDMSESESGRTAVVARGPNVILWPLLAAVAVLLILVLIAQDLDWTHLIVAAAIGVTTAGLMIAVNPRRGSPAGGTERH